MEDILKQILESQKQILGRLENLEIKTDNLHGQLEENTTILRALEHASMVNAAEMDGLKLSTATKESIQRLDAKFDVLNEQLFNQETELRLIKNA